MVIEPIRLHTSDELALEAELSVPPDPRAAVVLAHPHPRQGGNMRSIVPGALFAALPGLGVAALRFNFRGVEGSEGSYGGGIGERHDIVAAVGALHDVTEGLPLVLAGWSFGADTSLAVVDERITAWMAIAPPLRTAPIEDLVASADPRAKLLVVGDHDQYRPPEQARPLVAAWVNTELEVVAGADHFFVGRTDRLVELAVAYVDRLTR
ncbi:MAG TPA: hypothetical protein VF954_05970 [Acidimicrobiales bacterium]